MKTNNVLGVIAALAAGTLLGVLLAPDKGSKTRKKIKDKSKKVKDNLKEEFDDFLDTVSKKYTSLVDKKEVILNKEKEIVKEVVNSKN